MSISLAMGTMHEEGGTLLEIRNHQLASSAAMPSSFAADNVVDITDTGFILSAGTDTNGSFLRLLRVEPTNLQS